MSDQFSNYSQASNYPGYLADSLEAYQTHHNRLVQHHHTSRTTESKPRLSKEEVEILEAEFQKNYKPSSTTKKALAESMRVDNARINNWFQNRRAREKKENNIKEYEAKQRLEKERADSGDVTQPEKSRQRDLVASSAPFPQPAAISKQYSEASESPSEQSLPDQISDAGQSSYSESDSPFPLPIQEDDLIAKAEDENSCARPDEMDDYLSMQESSILNDNSNTANRQFFAEFSEFTGPESIQQSVENYDNDMDVNISTSSSPLADEYDVPSPDCIDIAARRNRRPAPLSIGGGRSNSYTAARANDNARKGDQATSMRRVSSSTSSGRVTKSVATPRSPFFDKNAASLFLRRPSPRAAGHHGSAAPPTPDTPVALQPQEPMGAPALYTLNGKYTSPDVIISDPTMRTPPTTPGFSDGLFHLGSGYEMSISEEALIAPGLGRLHAGMGMVNNAAAFANFNQCSSQHVVPMYPAQLSQSYFGFVASDGNSDYSWSDLSPSTASTSSNTQHQYMSFN